MRLSVKNSMSKFMSSKFADLQAYTPGEQPKDTKYIKLNTNESPFAPPKSVVKAMKQQGKAANLYSDPECALLRQKAAEMYGVEAKNVLAFNGSDEVLNFAFAAFSEKGVAYPAISYGFYSVFAKINGIDAMEIPLQDDLSISLDEYYKTDRMVVIANPNAPTGLCLSYDEIESLVASKPDRVVVIDEAYVLFGAKSVVPLTKKYDNLLVTQTFSKSHALAGARLGFGIANEKLIEDIDKLRNSTNPYNVNRMTQGAGCAAIDNNKIFVDNCAVICENRKYACDELKALGFTLTDSKANFLFAKSDKVSGEELYRQLKAKGILVRWFSKPDICDYVRITVGTKKQMKALISAIKEILENASK